jgi:hypothetical protein
VQVKLDEKVVRCFSHLRAPEFIALVEYLKATRQEALEKMAQVVDTDKIYRLQGQVGAIGEILQLVEGAENIMAKMNASRKAG